MSQLLLHDVWHFYLVSAFGHYATQLPSPFALLCQQYTVLLFLPPCPKAKFPGSPGSPTVRLVGRAVAQRFALRSSPATQPQSKISGGTIVHYVTVQVITLQ
jgi:hypothetical protein